MFRLHVASWFRLVAEIYRLFRLRVVLLLGVTIAAGIVDGLGMALLLPLLNLVGIGAPVTSGIGQRVAAAFAALGIQPSLEAILSAVLLLFALQGAIVAVQGYTIATIESAYVSHWREGLLHRLLTASWPYFARHRTGSLAYLVITESERLGRAFFLTIQLVATLVVAVAYIAISLAISWSLTLWLLGAFTLMAALAFAFSTSASYRLARDYGVHLDDLQALVTEFIGGAKVIKATAAEPYVLDRLRPLHRDIRRSYFGGVVIPYVLKSIIELAAIALFCLFIYGGVRVLGTDPGVLLVLLAMFSRLVPRLHGAQYNVQLLATYLPAYQRLEAAMQEITAASEPYAIDARERGFAACPAIAVDAVSVSYDERRALAAVSLQIPANTTVGIIGASGSGKSTLVDCLVGLTRPETGRITLDGVPLDSVNLRQWRSSIGYMAQETVLFGGTVRDVICQGRSIDEAAMIAAARRAHAHQLIADLPQGYDTVIGSSGIQLSGGQKQRLSLARALAGQPVMLVLDEPTSALDQVSEREIVAALRELHGSITIVIVSHRLSTVRDADRIFVLAEGRLAGEGAPEAFGDGHDLHHLLAVADAQ